MWLTVRLGQTSRHRRLRCDNTHKQHGPPTARLCAVIVICRYLGLFPALAAIVAQVKGVNALDKTSPHRSGLGWTS